MNSTRESADVIAIVINFNSGRKLRNCIEA